MRIEQSITGWYITNSEKPLRNGWLFCCSNLLTFFNCFVFRDYETMFIFTSHLNTTQMKEITTPQSTKDKVTDISNSLRETLKHYIGQPVSKSMKDRIRVSVISYISEILYRFNSSDLANDVSFEIDVEEQSTTCVITPNNFFTGLLIKGIFFVPALKGVNEYEAHGGKYAWDVKSKSMGFVPAMSAQHIVVVGGVDVSNEVEAPEYIQFAGRVNRMRHLQHTPAPWRYNSATNLIWSQVDRNGGNPVVAEMSRRHMDTTEMICNAIRIADCVNACEGIENPQEAIALLREFAQQLNSGANVSINPKGAYGKLITSLFKTK